MGATVLHMAVHRAVFILPDDSGTVVFLASRGPSPRIAHEKKFVERSDAETYACSISEYFGCSTVGVLSGPLNKEEAA